MRTKVLVASSLILAAGFSAATALSRRASAQSADSTHPLVTQAQFERWQTELSNWGRWGKDDEIGALNLITPAKRKQAAALVKEGFTVSLSSNASIEKAVDVPCPNEWAMVTASQSGATDRIAFPCIHGAGTTHLDAFGHIAFNGKMWNGYPMSLITKEHGASKNSILAMKSGVVTRGVLYDIPRLKGVAYLEPGARVYTEDLEAWEKKAGVKAGSGDALLFRWGRWARKTKLGAYPIATEMAGLDKSVIPWLKKRDIALIGWETPGGYEPQPPGDIAPLAVHNFVLAILGVDILDRADFDALSEAAAARNRWEFMLTIAPLAIPNGTGSPVNPIAIF
jgi:kynurenine formamidase